MSWFMLLAACEGTIFNPTWMSESDGRRSGPMIDTGVALDEDDDGDSGLDTGSSETADTSALDSADSPPPDTATDSESADSGGDTNDSVDSGDLDDSGITDTGDTGAADTGLVGADEVAAVELVMRSRLLGEFGGLAGLSIEPLGDVNGDGKSDVLVGAPGYDLERSDRASADVPVGAAYLVLGPVLGEHTLAESPARFMGEDVYDAAGYSLAHGDVNCDGANDLVLGAPLGRADANPVGRTYVVFAPFDGDIALGTAEMLEGEYGGDQFGLALTADDVNGDGCADVAIGTPHFQAFSNGRVEVRHGSPDGLAELPTLTVHGEMVFDQFGLAIRSADLNGDGVNELLASARYGDFHAEDAGAISAFDGVTQAEGVLYTDDAEATIGGRNNADGAGQSFAVGDLNADGHADVVVGVPYDDGGESDAGAAFVVPGPISGAIGVEEAPLAAFLGNERHEGVGTSVDVGDVNGDGTADILVGSPGRDNGLEQDAGQAYLVLGPVHGTHVLGDRANAVVAGEVGDGGLGRWVAVVGDVNGDGSVEFAFTSPYAGDGMGGVVSLFHLVE